MPHQCGIIDDRRKRKCLEFITSEDVHVEIRNLTMMILRSCDQNDYQTNKQSKTCCIVRYLLQMTDDLCTCNLYRKNYLIVQILLTIQ